MPKKGDGEHDLNAYGLKIQETDPAITAETYKAVGSVEDFEAKGEGEASEVSGEKDVDAVNDEATESGEEE
jgi:hypothetical protein